MAGVAIALAVVWMIIAFTEMLMEPRASLIDLDDHAATEITQRVVEEETTERARIAEEGQTERKRIDARTTGSIVAGVVIGVVGLAWAGVWAWGLRRQVQPPPPIPPELVAAAYALLAAKPGRKVDVVEGEWVVVDDAEQMLYPLLPAPVDCWTPGNVTGD